MKKADIVAVSSIALATATFTVLFASNPLEAGGETQALPAKIAKPKLVLQETELSLDTLEGQVFAAGHEPSFNLAAVNTSDAPAMVAVRVAMTGSSLRDALSRVIRLPSVLWQDDLRITLAPKERKVIPLNTKTKLPAGTMISVSLQDAAAATALGHALADLDPRPDSRGNTVGIVALSFSTGTPAPTTASVR